MVVSKVNRLEHCIKPLSALSGATADGLMPAGWLLAPSSIPIAAGTFRIAQLGGGMAITADNARFVAGPLPVVLYFVSAVMDCVLGAFQFSPSLRRRRPAWHRAAIWLLVPCGSTAAVSALWVTQFNARTIEPPAGFDGSAVYCRRQHNKGQMRWRLFEGTLNTDILIDFLRRLIKGATKRLLLILDKLRVHHAKPVKAWLAEHARAIEVFYLPSYSLELNLDEMANTDIKQAVTKLAPAHTELQLVKATARHLRSVQRQPERIRKYFEHDPVRYAA